MIADDFPAIAAGLRKLEPGLPRRSCAETQADWDARFWPRFAALIAANPPVEEYRRSMFVPRCWIAEAGAVEFSCAGNPEEW